MIKDSDLTRHGPDTGPPDRRSSDRQRPFGKPLRLWLGLTALSCLSLGGLLVFQESQSREQDILQAQATQMLVATERRQQASLMVEQTLGMIASRHRNYEHRLQSLLITTMRSPSLGISHLSGRDRSFISTELLRQFPDLRIDPDWIDIVQLPTTLHPEWWNQELNQRLNAGVRKAQFLRGTDAGLVFAVPLGQEEDSLGAVRLDRRQQPAPWALVHIDPKMVAFLVANELRQSLHASIEREESRYVWINEILDPAGGEGYARRLIHPLLPSTEGKLLSTEYQDSSGRFPYRTELEGVLNGSGIFFDYRFPKRPGAEQVDKTAYAALYPPFQWIIASGVYLDDISEAALKAHADLMKKKHALERWHFLITLLVTLMLCLAFGYAFLRQYRERQLQMRQRMNQLEHELEQRGEDRLGSVMRMIREERCPERSGEDYLAANLVGAIATRLGMDRQEIATLERVAMLHDIGKLALPDSLLRPRDELHFDQYHLLRRHVEVGARMMEDALMAPAEADLLRASQQFMLGAPPHADISQAEQASHDIAATSHGETSLTASTLALVVQIIELVRHTGVSEAQALCDIKHRHGHLPPELLQAAREVLTEQPIPPAPTLHRLCPQQVERDPNRWRDNHSGCFTRALLDAALEALSRECQDAMGQHITLCHLRLSRKEGARRDAGDRQLAPLDAKLGPHLNACFHPLRVFRVSEGNFIVMGHQCRDISPAQKVTRRPEGNEPLFEAPANGTASPPTADSLASLLSSLEDTATLEITLLDLSCAQTLKEWQLTLNGHLARYPPSA
ncbi:MULTISPECIES: cache domain-containing protein [unclassified Cobetia]|uniref:cache domain-containing protein n=1 Tax=unclassified Cobetia TaxID=2609414 RepID=UPI0020979E5C|nr:MULTISPECIES: cache domain-containing protein [unclassified Cobetia]MCO7233143.1 cache domain-containing protein [Cobetia sp. Dlab-2-AX]MCO7236417.1 cache domain-containing protein [Cobetia sp. Dlab-2-U]